MGSSKLSNTCKYGAHGKAGAVAASGAGVELLAGVAVAGKVGDGVWVMVAVGARMPCRP